MSGKGLTPAMIEALRQLPEPGSDGLRYIDLVGVRYATLQALLRRDLVVSRAHGIAKWQTTWTRKFDKALS